MRASSNFIFAIAMLSWSFRLVAALVPPIVQPHTRKGVAFYPPKAGGGSNLDDAGKEGGEPLNVIISGLSSPDVLTDSGFLNFMRSLGQSNECLNIHIGAPQSANLGDGHGPVNQTIELREDFRQAFFGTCLESLIGGNHLRMFRQNGPKASSGALFLAVSVEASILREHTIVKDGYNRGRDLLVKKATARPTAYGRIEYSSVAEEITGLLEPGMEGINHNITQDGIVKLLTVTIIRDNLRAQTGVHPLKWILVSCLEFIYRFSVLGLNYSSFIAWDFWQES